VSSPPATGFRAAIIVADVLPIGPVANTAAVLAVSIGHRHKIVGRPTGSGPPQIAGLVGLTEAGISKHLKLLPLHHSEHTVGATSYPADSVHATRPRFSAVHGQTQGGCIFRTPQPT
jgi:hypothetical protein